jgi:hypothetical protein
LACRLAIFAMVARLQAVAACIALQLWPAFSMEAMPALRATCLYLPSAFRRRQAQGQAKAGHILNQ